ncbi:hypothetical protein SBD_5940 [Streptomyces bottropensis ATCC 25435]|uniref:Uncharacterized protein n=1 Tax=Streptomyces bottropensis ATCC 25435 TaxID=1054862 RepID=M3FLA5_9ACTN|nr:hypothetical protein SBD_5940 [Streptomyces bottropensis ATCC 25435]
MGESGDRAREFGPEPRRRTAVRTARWRAPHDAAGRPGVSRGRPAV